MIEITIRTRHQPEGFQIKAYPSAVPGLAVHRDTDANDKPISDTWAVTHSESGKAVLRQFKTRRAALQFAARIRNLTDWTQPGDLLVEQRGLFMEGLRKVRDAFSKERYA